MHGIMEGFFTFIFLLCYCLTFLLKPVSVDQENV